MTAFASTGERCCQVLELRQYTLKPGQRDALIELFDREFVESQEALGMTLMGQFRDRRNADRFVWLRGFADMEQRHKVLDAFYSGPVWAAHKAAANATMEDVSDVLLLKPARPDLAFQPRTPARSNSSPALVLAGIYQMQDTVSAGIVSRFEAQVAPVLAKNGVRLEGVFVTEPSPNTFTRLPVREGENVLVWFGTVEPREMSSASLEQLAGAAALDGRRPMLLDLEPTSRSVLGGGANAARATRHDFDFIFGSWKIHNRSLKERLRGSTEWLEWEATSRTEPLLHGYGHLDRFAAVRDGQPFEGITLRLFDPATGQWWIHWADTRYARTLIPPMVGRFIGGVGEFFGDETVNGKKVLCRFLWTPNADGTARWEQAFSEDGGKTWETNWIMMFTRGG